MQRRARATVVAQRAVDLAAGAEVELSDGLALWRLAGGRPPVSGRSVAGLPDDLGAALEAAHAWPERRRLGVHYTPTEIADGLALRAIGSRVRPTIGDPCCGGGALLLAAGRALVQRGVPREDAVRLLHGADVDPLAVATTEAALMLWAGAPPTAGQLVVADALVAAPWTPVDVLVGNPPFATPLSTSTARGARRAEAVRAHLGPAVAAYTDEAALHLLASLALTAEGGSSAVLVPRSVLAARDARGVRDAIEMVATIREVWLPPATFDAAVDVCAIVADRTDAPLDDAGRPPWSFHLARAQGVPEVSLTDGPTVGDEVEAVAGFRQEYYDLVPHVVEARDRPSGRPLVTTGLIDLGVNRWGEHPARFGGRRWAAPVVDPRGLVGRGKGWADRTHRPKVLVAGQSRVIETAVDPSGETVPGVPLVAVLAPVERLWALAAAIAAPPVVAWAAIRVAGTGRSPGTLRVGAPLVRQVPLPIDDEAWVEGAAALAAGDLAAFAGAMTAAYGAAPWVARWWADLAKVACPAPGALR